MFPTENFEIFNSWRCILKLRIANLFCPETQKFTVLLTTKSSHDIFQ